MSQGREPQHTPAGAGTPGHGSARAALRAFSDAPLSSAAGDGLAFAPYADALAGLLDNPDTGTPLTLAINAPWGAGKSTLAHMLRRRLLKKPAADDIRPHVVCWFNAWMHDDATSLSSAFAAEVARVANRARHPLRRILRPLPRALWSRAERWFFWLSLLVVFSLLFIGLMLGWQWAVARWNEVQVLAAMLSGTVFEASGVATNAGRDALGVGGLSVLLTVVVGRVPKLIAAAESVASFLEDPEAAASFGSIAQVRAQLGQLIQQARRGARRFVVFVDDLERCHPPRAIELLEVVAQLLDHPGVVVVIMGDMPAVAACADIKYRELAELHVSGDASEGLGQPGGYGRLYVRKIVQLQFDLPPNTLPQIEALLARLAGAPAAAAEAEQPKPLLRARLARALQRVPLLGTRRRRLALARARGQADRMLAEGTDLEQVERVLALESGLPPDQGRAIARERQLLRLMNDADLLQQAHAEVADHLAPYPRSLKRFLNSVRVLAAAAHARGVVDQWPPLRPRHFGRWAALKECWPLAAQAALRKPERLRELEAQARAGKALDDTLAAWGAESWDAAEIAVFLRSGTVTLGEVAERVVQLAPAPPRGPQAPVAPSESGPAPAASGTPRTTPAAV